MGKPRSTLADIQRGEREWSTTPMSSTWTPTRCERWNFATSPPGRGRVRVTVEYVSGEVRVLTVHKFLLARLLEDLYAA